MTFPLEDAIWTNAFYTIEVFPPPAAYTLIDVDYFCVNGDDTLIQSGTYTKIFHCGDEYKGALRDSSGVIYFVPKDSLNEFLMYDFNAYSGQIIPDVIVADEFSETYSLVAMTVGNTVTTTQYGGQERRVVQLNDASGDALWIEGIGCQTGLFFRETPNVSNYAFRLDCMSVNGSTIYPNPAPGSCALTFNLTDNEILSSNVNIYPNPTDAKFIVESRFNIKSIELIDNTGRLISRYQAEMGKTVIDLSTIVRGLYVVHIQAFGGRMERRVISRN